MPGSGGGHSNFVSAGRHPARLGGQSALIRRIVPAALLAAALLPGAARAEAADTPERVQALVERAAAHIRVVGEALAFSDITSPNGGFVEGDLYVFCLAADGTMVAHGGNPQLVGKALSTLRDSEGTLPVVEILRIGQTQGHGWVEYLWPNQQTRRIQRKTAYVLRIDEGTVCASGYYKPETP
jgi:hypothetical protein